MSKTSKAEQVKAIANLLKYELGFVNLAALKVSENAGTLEIVGDGIGFANFHHRKDGQTTIYEIAVVPEYQNQGWGRLLFYRVLCSAIEKQQTSVYLKCPVDLPSNVFYEKLGFKLEEIQDGKKRKLNCWRYKIELPLLFYCADGGRNKYGAIAKAHGWFLGACSAGSDTINHQQMIDNNFRNYQHSQHLERIKKHKPLIAIAKDIDLFDDTELILQQASEIAKYCGRVLLVPKVPVNIPSNYWLGYSVDSSYGQTTVDLSFFSGKNIHLLGGSTKNQQKVFRKLSAIANVVSIDGNFAMKIAKYGKSTCFSIPHGKRIANHGRDINYRAFELSMQYLAEDWHNNSKWHQLSLFGE